MKITSRKRSKSRSKIKIRKEGSTALWGTGNGCKSDSGGTAIRQVPMTKEREPRWIPDKSGKGGTSAKRLSRVQGTEDGASCGVCLNDQCPSTNDQKDGPGCSLKRAAAFFRNLIFWAEMGRDHWS